MAGPESLSRRKFLGIATVSIGGLISLGYIIPGIKYIVAPAARKKEVQDWIRLGSTDKVEIGTPT